MTGWRHAIVRKHWQTARYETILVMISLTSFNSLFASPCQDLESMQCPNKDCSSHQLYVLLFHSPPRHIELEHGVFCTLGISPPISSYPPVVARTTLRLQRNGIALQIFLARSAHLTWTCRENTAGSNRLRTYKLQIWDPQIECRLQ